ncbi:hypothetical protein D3C86_2236580 [compost metagenome]
MPGHLIQRNRLLVMLLDIDEDPLQPLQRFPGLCQRVFREFRQPSGCILRHLTHNNCQQLEQSGFD